MLFIKPSKPYIQLTIDDVINPTSDTELRFDEVTGSWVIINESGQMSVREGLYQLALEENQYIKIDFTKSKARRVLEMNPLKPSQVLNKNINIPITPTAENITIETTKLKDVEFDPKLFIPLKTGTYIDKFLSRRGGFMPASNVMMSGGAGVGKSANLIEWQIRLRNNNPGKKILYISGEMTQVDVKEFEEYYPEVVELDFLYITDFVTDPNSTITATQALLSCLNQGWDLVAIDSLVEIQSMIQEDLGLSKAKAEKWLLDLLIRHNKGHNILELYTIFIGIQQETKGGEFVGSNRLKHITDCSLKLKWDPKEKGKRYMIFNKNRKGKEKIKLYYYFNGTDGIAYDEVRHTKELEIMERLQSPANFEVEELSLDDLEDLFKVEPEQTT